MCKCLLWIWVRSFSRTKMESSPVWKGVCWAWRRIFTTSSGVTETQQNTLLYMRRTSLLILFLYPILFTVSSVPICFLLFWFLCLFICVYASNAFFLPMMEVRRAPVPEASICCTGEMAAPARAVRSVIFTIFIPDVLPQRSPAASPASSNLATTEDKHHTKSSCF